MIDYDINISYKNGKFKITILNESNDVYEVEYIYQLFYCLGFILNNVPLCERDLTITYSDIINYRDYLSIK